MGLLRGGLLKLFVCGLGGSFAQGSVAEPDEGRANFWFDIGTGYNVMLMANLNVRAMSIPWRLSLVEHDDFGSVLLSRTRKNRATGREEHVTFREVGLSYLWHRPWALGYANASLGLGWADGVSVSHCGRSETEIKGRHSAIFCDFHTVKALAVPIQLTTTFGRFAGVGAFAKGAYIPGASYIELGVSFSFGDFTR